MPLLTNYFYEKTKLTKTNNYIETGTYLGNGIKCVMNDYKYVHSIELAEKWYNFNVDQFSDNKNVTIYLGDSKKTLPKLLELIDEPVTIYLDAHYYGGTTAFGEEETPLLAELEILKERKHDDIIIIDDCRLLEKKGECGCGPNHPVYPQMNYDWSDITNEKIRNLLKKDYIILNNEKKEYTNGAIDQFVLCKLNLTNI